MRSPMTHYVPAFTSYRALVYVAICGAFVHSRRIQREHSAEPTCLKCLEWLDADAKEAAALAAKWTREEDEKRRARITNASFRQRKDDVNADTNR